jgi:dUTPase
MNPTLKIARVCKSALPLPTYQSDHAAGIDLMADIAAPIEMAPRVPRYQSAGTRATGSPDGTFLLISRSWVVEVIKVAYVDFAVGRL